MAGGLQALLQNPAQLARLKADPSLLNSAVDEMIRYTSPVRHFMRTAQADAVVGGVEVKAGDWLYLSYLAANRDPELFVDPHAFDVGAHFCLGAQLARMELRTVFRDLFPRLEYIELAGPPLNMKTTFVGGTKSLPISYRLTPSA